MISLRMVARGLMRQKVSFGLHALTVAITTAVLTAVLCLAGALHATPDVPGAACVGNLFVLGLQSAAGDDVRKVSIRQIDLMSTIKSANLMPVSLFADSMLIDNREFTGTIAFADPRFLDAACVGYSKRRDVGSWEALLGDRVDPGESASRLSIGGANVRVGGTVKVFRGLHPTLDNISAWIPFSTGVSSNYPLEEGIIKIYGVLQPGHSLQDVTEELRSLRVQHAGEMGQVADFVPERNVALVSTDRAAIRQLLQVSSIIAATFILLTLCNLWIYESVSVRSNIGRLNVMRVLGGTRRQLAVLAIIEATILFGVCLPAAFACLAAVIRQFPELLDLSELRGEMFSWRALWICLSLLAAYAALVAGYRGVLSGMVHSRAKARKPSRAAMGLLTFLQATAATLTVSLALCAALGLWKITPNARGYDLSDVRAYVIEKGEGGKKAKSAASAAQAIQLLRAQPHLVVGASDKPIPVEWSSIEQSPRVVYAGRTVPVIYNRFVGDYFEALKIKVVEGDVQSAPIEAAADPPESSTVVVNRALASELFGGSPAVGKVITLQTVYTATAGLTEGKAAQIIGVVDEVSSGTQDAQSWKRLQPTVYLPQSDNNWATFQQVIWVRHPAGYSTTQLDALVQTIAPTVIRDGRVGFVCSGSECSDSVIGKERSASFLIYICALAVVVICVTGLLTTSAQRLMSEMKSTAIRVAIGQSRAACARRFIVRCTIPSGIGVAVGALLTFAAVSAFENQLPAFAALGIPSGILGATLVAVMCVMSTVPCALRIMSLDVPDALRVANT